MEDGSLFGVSIFGGSDEGIHGDHRDALCRRPGGGGGRRGAAGTGAAAADGAFAAAKGGQRPAKEERNATEDGKRDQKILCPDGH